jgi:Spy/CpxP family protein refolding chaperone
MKMKKNKLNNNLTKEDQMRKKGIILLIAGFVFASFTFMLESAPMQRKMMRHARFGIMMAEKNLFPAEMLLRNKDEIGLTKDQVTRIEKMQELYQESVIRKQADIKVEELKFRSYLKNDQIDRSKMEKMIRVTAKMRTDSQVDHINYLLDLRNLLTPEQIEKIEALKKERMHKMMRHRDMRKPWGKMGLRERPKRPLEDVEGEV